MNKKFEPLSSGEVLSLNVYDDYDTSIVYEEGMFKMPHTFKKSELEQGIRNILIEFDSSYVTARKKLLNEGLSCEALRFGSQNWRKGKMRVKVSVEFCPDEAEELIEDGKSLNGESKSSLDDIRQMIS
ncbi:KGK domain-containing protein [Trichocoleus sp. FACHB-591]|uniref:KGK domain-containing protein n=1 Tax=Trichocoleus sp. FACHB-591 TaxID=2692872 RepID=UPI001688E4C1|nr:KGK domain-containing protein [Trichocoleus sp. FACHB-591]MBD2097050.1 KGK domain-containing protein [Trichocoleus sp. FACHB-591]